MQTLIFYVMFTGLLQVDPEHAARESVKTERSARSHSRAARGDAGASRVDAADYAHDRARSRARRAVRAGGRIDTGRHINYAAHTPLSNLYLAMIQAFGILFGDRTGVARGVVV